MPTPLPVSFSASPLPLTFKGSPQQMLDAFVARLQLNTETNLALFTTGSTAPLTDSGPWLKNGITWYVWDVSTGAYIPEVLESQSLQYIAQQQPPDPALYTFWIALDANGNPINIQYYANSQWVDIYANQIASLINQIAQAIYTPYNTTAGMGGSNQTLTVNGSYYVIQYGAILGDPYSLYTAGSYTYTAPVAGWYHAGGHIQVDNIDGNDTGMELGIQLFVNGSAASTCYGGTAVPNTFSNRWYPNFTGQVHLNAGDAVTINLFANDTTAYAPSDTGTVNLSNGDWDIFLIRPDDAAAPPASRVGTFTMNGSLGVTVANTAIDANSVVVSTLKTESGSVTIAPYITTITPGTGFTANAGSGDFSTYNYVIIN